MSCPGHPARGEEADGQQYCESCAEGSQGHRGGLCAIDSGEDHLVASEDGRQRRRERHEPERIAGEVTRCNRADGGGKGGGHEAADQIEGGDEQDVIRRQTAPSHHGGHCLDRRQPKAGNDSVPQDHPRHGRGPRAFVTRCRRRSSRT